jgi:hypothetical protein
MCRSFSVLVAPALLVVAFAACASHQTVVVWEKPGATCDEAEAARQACSEEIDRTAARGVNRDRLEAETTGSRFVECMRERGFTWRTQSVDCRASEADDAVSPDS